MDKVILVAVSAVVGIVVTLFLESRRNSIKQARESNPEFYRELHRKTVILREAIEGFGSVWNQSADEYNEFVHDLYRILVAKVEYFNRELSVSTNEDVFLLPANLQSLCEEIRSLVTLATYETDIVLRTKIVTEDVSGQRTTQKHLPTCFDDLKNVRFVETKRRPSLIDSAFGEEIFQKKLTSKLKKLERKIKRLAVN